MYDFIMAAFPWVVIGLIIALIASFSLLFTVKIIDVAKKA